MIKSFLQLNATAYQIAHKESLPACFCHAKVRLTSKTKRTLNRVSFYFLIIPRRQRELELGRERPYRALFLPD